MPASGRSEVPGSELDLVDIEPEPVGGDLGERGPGALAHVVRADLHDAAAVLAQHRFGFGLEHQRRKRRRAHAPADQQSVSVAHLPGRERTALPSRNARRLARSIRAAPLRRTACRRSARPRHSS